MDTLCLLHAFIILYSNYIWVKSYGIQDMVECYSNCLLLN